MLKLGLHGRIHRAHMRDRGGIAVADDPIGGRQTQHEPSTSGLAASANRQVGSSFGMMLTSKSNWRMIMSLPPAGTGEAFLRRRAHYARVGLIP